MKNANLTAAKKAKNDEFYTREEDVIAELQHYTSHFENKVVYCNCDDPMRSNFWKYFHENFARLKLKRLVASFYAPKEIAYSMTYEGREDGNIKTGTAAPLQQNGDFRSSECIELLEEADIVVTNPPFSIARSDYLPLLIQHQKKFLIIGDLNWVTYKSVFPLIKNNQIWMGYNTVKQFIQPDGTLAKFGNKLWYTNLDIPKRHESLQLTEHYTPERYPQYHNYDAIECSRTAKIPCDYEPCWYQCPYAEKCVYAQTESSVDNALCEHNDDFFFLAREQTGQNGTELLACQSHTFCHTQKNFASSDLLLETSKDLPAFNQKQINRAHGSTGSSCTAEFSFKKCSGVIGVPISSIQILCPKQFKILGISLGTTVDYPMTTIYEDAIQHNKNGTTQSGSKVNTRTALLVSKKPNGAVYYTANNTNGFLLSVYPRILIRKEKYD